jgi:hypothetical protein
MDAVIRRTRAILPYAPIAALVVALPVLALVLRHHREQPAAAPSAPAAGPPKPVLPPPGGIVLAREHGKLAVALSARGRQVVATVLSPEGGGASGLRVAFRGAGPAVPATGCGSGCYAARLPRPSRRVEVVVGGAPVPFALPDRARPAADLVRHAAAALGAARSVTIDERLASSPTHAIRARFRVAAPDRLTYRIAGGSDAVVIGARRWDRASPRERWVESAQTPLRLPTPTWTTARDARLLARSGGTATVAFLDPTIPAWFRVRLDRRTFRPLEVRMIAAAHFMRDRYSGYDAPLEIRPPRQP